MNVTQKRCDVCHKIIDISYDPFVPMKVGEVERDFCSYECATQFIKKYWDIVNRVTNERKVVDKAVRNDTVQVGT